MAVGNTDPLLQATRPVVGLIEEGLPEITTARRLGGLQRSGEV